MKQKCMSIFILWVLTLSMIAGCAPAAPATEQPAATSQTTQIPAVKATAGNLVAQTPSPSVTAQVTKEANTGSLVFNNKTWQYDATNNIYWQIGIKYCTKPEAADYETLGIFVPGAYMTAKANGDGTYTATINEQGTVNGFTAKNAPMVFPVNTPGYSAQKAPTAYSYDGLSSYLKAGFIYIYAGMRGKENGYDANKKLLFSGGAPWGVTDLKAAVRYVRYNKGVLPGNTDSIFVFGHSGGGAQSSVMGATGDSKLYYPYLESIGAAMVDANGQTLSDAISGVMAWCPITSLDYADEAYEWNMGQYVSTNTRASTTWTSALSKDLATAYAEYINTLGIKDQNGNVLVLEKSENGIYAAGSYYKYLLSTIEESLNNFLADTKFPYTESSGGFMAGGNFPGGGIPQGGTPPSGAMPQNGTPSSGTMPAGGAPVATTTPKTFQTVQEYINSLNQDAQWVNYDPKTNRVTLASLMPFVSCCKTASKSVAAFDDLNRTQAENNVFGNDESDALHFDFVLADLLAKNQKNYATYADWKASIVDAYATDLKALDKLGNGIQYRQNMYNPMYYLLPYYKGYQTSTVARYWRIHTGIKQGDTATTVEMNLALALKNYSGVKSVDFATVWNQGHTMAERTGTGTDNFVAWVQSVVK